MKYLNTFQVEELQEAESKAVIEMESQEITKLQRQILSLEDQLTDKTKVLVIIILRKQFLFLLRETSLTLV